MKASDLKAGILGFSLGFGLLVLGCEASVEVASEANVSGDKQMVQVATLYGYGIFKYEDSEVICLIHASRGGVSCVSRGN